LADTITMAAKSLKDLNAAMKDGDKIFQGFLGTMVDVAAKTDGAGRAWTVFSRLTSGSPVWKLQNKARAYLGILAGVQNYTMRAEKAQRKSNRAVIDSIESLEGMRKELNLLEDGFKMFKVNGIALDEQMMAAVKSTDAYAKGLILGRTETQLYNAAIKELNASFKVNEERVDKFKANQQAQAKFQRQLTTPQGRASAKMKIDSDNKETIKTNYTLTYMLASNIARGKNLQSIFDGIQEYTDFRKKSNKKTPRVTFGDIRKAFKSGGMKEVFRAIRGQDKNLGIVARLLKAYSAYRLATNRFVLKFAKKASKLIGGIKPLLSMLMKFLIYSILGIFVFMAVAKILYEIADLMGDLNIMDDISAIIEETVSVMGKVFEIIGNFIDGDFEAMFGNFQSIFNSVLRIGFRIGKVLLKASIAILVGGFYALIDMFSYAFEGTNFIDIIFPTLVKLGLLWVAAMAVQYFVGVALTLAGIYAIPVGMIILISAFIIALYKKFQDSKFVKGIMIAVTILGAILSFVLFAAGFAAGGWVVALGVGIGMLIVALQEFFGANFKFFKKATGGTSHGGMTMVGEQGPELVNLPAGAQVKTNYQTNRMMGGTTVNNYITINARDTSKQEMKRIANELSNMINMKINRSGASRTMR